MTYYLVKTLDKTRVYSQSLNRSYFIGGLEKEFRIFVVA